MTKEKVNKTLAAGFMICAIIAFCALCSFADTKMYAEGTKRKLEEAQKRIEDLETDKEVLVEVNQNLFRMLQEERKNAE